MTRFELANRLNNRLYTLTESERRRIIDKHISTINDAVAAGESEADAIAALGDIDRLADVILARHHIDAAKVSAAQEIPLHQDETIETPETEEKESIIRKLKEKADSIKSHSNKNLYEEKESTAAKAENTVMQGAKTVATKTGDAIKSGAGATGGLLAKLGRFTANFTFSLINLTVFICIWIPAMLLTVGAIICTIATMVLYIFSGIGFMGVCIMGAGCCVMGVVFTLWLGAVLTGGGQKCEEY